VSLRDSADVIVGLEGPACLLVKRATGLSQPPQGSIRLGTVCEVDSVCHPGEASEQVQYRRAPDDAKGLSAPDFVARYTK
jgi:hypothetical protein